ncbi:hypothetical protein [Caldisphaera sp.]|uniref:hypothetical protein n=1 Tax=Caldisphaera sp. TaxID=2060322 RepID=UPI0025C362F2|nr:hypothetical protein [Caldisphaera sp.]
MNEYEFELIEEYYLNGEHRFRLKEKKSNLIFNVSADNIKEAARKASQMLSSLKNQ